MTTMHINGSDTATVRLFALDLSPEDVEPFVTEAGPDAWPLRAALGAEALRADFVDTVRIEDLGEMTLSAYLTEAHGVPRDALSDMRGRIDALDGHVVILPAQAFGGVSQDLRVADPLRWVGTFGEIRPAPRGPKLRSTAAQGGESGRKPVSDAAMSGRIASLALLVLFVLVGVMIWIAA